MCSRLEQEYRIWLEELLEVLHELCEDVVPAGRVDENIYWKTKALYNARQFQRRDDFEMELLRYAADGRAPLEAVKSALVAVECRTEETVIRLRRENATAILGSLQFFVNFAFLADRHLQNEALYKEVCGGFEVDERDEVKRIRSGVVVTGKRYTAMVRRYPICARQSEHWEHPIAG